MTDDKSAVACVECGRPVDRVLPDPIPEGYELAWTESITGRALYCTACYQALPDEGETDDD